MECYEHPTGRIGRWDVGTRSSGPLIWVLREIRRFDLGFFEVDSVFQKKNTARCVHDVGFGGLSGGVAGSFKLKLKTDLKNKFETGKPHLEKPSVICHHLVVFIQHDPSELRGL